RRGAGGPTACDVHRAVNLSRRNAGVSPAGPARVLAAEWEGLRRRCVTSERFGSETQPIQPAGTPAFRRAKVRSRLDVTAGETPAFPGSRWPRHRLGRILAARP